MICYDEKSNMDSLLCGHVFCDECWRGFVDCGIGDRTIFSSKCPAPDCNLKLTLSIMTRYTTRPDLLKKIKLENFVEDSQQLRYCPAPGCQYVAKNTLLGRRDIQCMCNFQFCFACGEESHRPAFCSEVLEWLLKNLSESENVTWIIANTKPCPNCKKPIEKNQGCNHMYCAPEVGGCDHHFCWICLVEWTKHGGYDGYNNCNRFQ